MRRNLPRARTGGCIDWRAIRERIDLADVITRETKRTALGRRPRWLCPFHDDHHPSLTLTPDGRRFKCWSCGAEGDALDFVRRLHPEMSFPEAVARLAGGPSPSGGPMPHAYPRPVPRASARDDPAGMSPEAAAALVAEAADRLWSPEGAQALAYLSGVRLLSPETIRAARLGVVTRRGQAVAAGIVIPWFAGDAVKLVKVRPFSGRPKYLEAFRDREREKGLYPGPERIRPGRPLIVVEGEFDALLLGQAVGALAAVVTSGGAASGRDDSGGIDPAILRPSLAAPRWYIATDADDAGDRTAAAWPAPGRRVRPPGPHKDWTEAAAAGVNLARFWRDVLAGIAPAQAGWRWGPARDDDEPGIVR